ncbi:hypothetical protein C365_02262 [Cryptococcus neoformans Bt85]|nr:hypothetical protein C365_02262 [Cryptococcus neoformans var. grubii Bt85]
MSHLSPNLNPSQDVSSTEGAVSVPKEPSAPDRTSENWLKRSADSLEANDSKRPKFSIKGKEKEVENERPRVTINWKNDLGHNARTAEQILIAWMSVPENWEAWRSAQYDRRLNHFADVIIRQKLIEAGTRGDERSSGAILAKIEKTYHDFKAAYSVAERGDNTLTPEEIERGITDIQRAILSYCKYYYELFPALSSTVKEGNTQASNPVPLRNPTECPSVAEADSLQLNADAAPTSSTSAIHKSNPNAVSVTIRGVPTSSGTSVGPSSRAHRQSLPPHFTPPPSSEAGPSRPINITRRAPPPHVLLSSSSSYPPDAQHWQLELESRKITLEEARLKMEREELERRCDLELRKLALEEKKLKFEQVDRDRSYEIQRRTVHAKMTYQILETLEKVVNLGLKDWKFVKHLFFFDEEMKELWNGESEEEMDDVLSEDDAGNYDRNAGQSDG